MAQLLFDLNNDVKTLGVERIRENLSEKKYVSNPSQVHWLLLIIDIKNFKITYCRMSIPLKVTLEPKNVQNI